MGTWVQWLQPQVKRACALVAGPVTPHCAAAQGVRVTEVPLSTGSLGSDDVFILDLGQKIIVWAGSAATGMEKNKALTYTVALRDDRDHKGTAQVSVVLTGHS